MNKIRATFFFLIFFLMPLQISANDNPLCTNEEKLRLRELVGGIQIVYELREIENPEGGTFKIFEVLINGFHPDFYVWNQKNGILFEYNDSPVTSLVVFSPGMTYQLPFLASEKSPCYNYSIFTTTISLPHYNYYSDDPLCDGHENFELCKKLSPIKVESHSEFLTRLEKYIKDLENTNTDEPNNGGDPSKRRFFVILFAFLLKYNLYILTPIITISAVGIIVIELKKRRSIL